MITGIIIAKNEQSNIAACLSGLDFCSDLLVVNNGSVDNTVKIAKRAGAGIINIPRSGDFAYLRNMALKNVHTPWVIFVDADERISPQLAKEIISVVADTGINGYLIRRTDHLWGKTLRFGDVGNKYLLRLGRSDGGQWVGKVHETWEISGKIKKLSASLDHYPHPDLAGFISRLNLYSGIRSAELNSQGIKSGVFPVIFFPLFKFIYLWIFRLGFLDGTAGLVHAMSMAFYSFLVRSKLFLRPSGIKDA